jgi:hypothetical protein
VVGSLGTIGDFVAGYERTLGRPLRLLEISDETFHRNTLARGRTAQAATHLTRLWGIFRMISASGAARSFPPYQVTDAIERIGGQRAQDFEDFLAAQREALATAGSR